MVTGLQTGAVLVQGGIVATLLEGGRRRNVPAVVNALVALAASLTPAAVELLLGDVTFGPELTLWVAVAGFLHSLGMLGLYDTRWWWDHLTHTISAALVTALLYAGLVVVGATTRLPDHPAIVAGVTLGLLLAAGVFWELIELVARDVGETYGIEPVLVHYGRRDTALDLVFDLVGALLVVVFDLRVFVPVAEQFPRGTVLAVTGATGLVVGGSALLALVVWFGIVR